MSIGTFIKNSVAPFVVAQLPTRLCWKFARRPLVMPYYHIVSDEEVPHVRHIYRYRSVTEFSDDLDYLLAHYTPVRLEDIIRHLKDGAALPDRAFHLTFDDGFREMHDVAMPILLAKGIPATFFLATDFIDNKGMAHHNQISVLIGHTEAGGGVSAVKAVETLLAQNGVPGTDFKSRLLAVDYARRHLVKEAAALCGCDLAAYQTTRKPYLSTAQVRTLLARGFSIGAHSLDHPLYMALGLEEQIRQTRGSMKFVADTFGIPCRSFAFPHMDAGVGAEFFASVFGAGGLEVSFGTAGMQPHFFPGNIERFTMEKTSLPAARILARQYARRWYSAATRRAGVEFSPAGLN